MAIDNNPFADLPDAQSDPFADLPDAKKSGLLAALGSGIDQLQETGYRAVKGFTEVGENPNDYAPGSVGRGIASAIGQGGALSRWADEGIQRNQEEAAQYQPAVSSYKDIGSVSDAASYVGEMTAQSIPMMAAAFNPVTAFAMGGGLANEAYEEQEDKQPWRAVASGFGQMGLERLGAETAIGRVFGGEGGNIGKRIGQSMLGEGATETGQEALAQWGGGKSIDELENLDEAFVGGAAVGGSIRGATEAGQFGLNRFRPQQELNNDEELDLTAAPAADPDLDPFANVTPESDQPANAADIAVIPGNDKAKDWEPNWQFGQNDMPYRGQMQPYQYEGEYEQYRETPNSVPVGNVLEAPVIDGEYRSPYGLPDRSDVIYGTDGRPQQQAQEFAGQVFDRSGRQLGYNDVIYASGPTPEPANPNAAGDAYWNQQQQQSGAELQRRQRAQDAQNQQQLLPQKDIIFAGDNRGVQMKKDGKPFGGRRAAELTQEFKRARDQGLNPEVVRVNGGYGWVTSSQSDPFADLPDIGDPNAGNNDLSGIDTGTEYSGRVGNIDQSGSAGIPQLAEQSGGNGVQTDPGLPTATDGQAGTLADGRIGNDSALTNADALTDIDIRANEAATSPTNDLPEPTQAQKDAGNYKKGRIKLHGLNISIENPKGSTRSGTDADGNEWQTQMQHHYGDIKATTGADGDAIDVFVGDKPDSQKVFVVDQVDPKTGEFDEAKAMMGFDTVEEAEAAYRANYDENWQGLGNITETSVDDFKTWLKKPRKSKQAFAKLQPKTDFDTASSEELTTLFDSQKGNSFMQSTTEDWGDLRGQGKRTGKMVMGGMRDASLQGKKTYTDILGKLKQTEPENYQDINLMASDENYVKSAYARAREAGADHDMAVRYALSKSARDPASFDEMLKIRRNKNGAADQPESPASPTLKPKNSTPRDQQKIDTISDFGEKLEGAKKHTWGGFSETVKEEIDVSAVPLSKSFPDPDYKKMSDEGADKKVLGFISMLKASIPTKPRTKYKVSSWSDTVNRARKISSDLTDGTITLDEAKRKVRGMGIRFSGIAESVDAFDSVSAEALKQAGKRWRIDSGSFSMFNGERFDKPRNKFFITKDGRPDYNQSFDTQEEATAFLRKQLKGEKAEAGKRQSKISVYQDRYTKEYFLGWKGANGVLRISSHDNIVDARKELRDNRDAVEAKLAKLKETPSMRRPENRKRVGQARFEGNVSPDYFSEEFGFRGVQFGNYVENKKRQQDLNQAYDGLIDLSEAIGVPPRALSLDGKLGIAFGARGNGGKNPAAAHYETGNAVINLTKKNGSGSLAHEWFHALDNYFANGSTSKQSYMTEENRYKRIEGIRPEMREAFLNVINAIEDTQMPARSGQLDKRQSKRYWDTKLEMAARAFERYIIDKLDGNAQQNDYLANVVSESAWAETETEGTTYPYPTEAEAKKINAAFDRFFRTIEHRETDNGNVALFKRASNPDTPTNNSRPVVSAADADKVISDFRAGLSDGAGDNFVVASSYDQLPDDIKEHAKQQGAEGDVKGVFHKGKVFVVLDQHTSPVDLETTLFHEAYGHQGISNLFGKDITQKLNKLFTAIGGMKGLRETAARHGINLEGYISGIKGTDWPQDVKHRVLMDELLAHLQQDNKPSVKRMARELVGAVRQGLKKLGLMNLSNVSDSDLFYILRQARKASQNGDTVDNDVPLFRRTDESESPAFRVPDETMIQKYIIRRLQDKFSRVKQTQKAIKDSGRNISESSDVYGTEALYYGKVEEDFRQLDEKFIEPMAKKMAAADISQQELDLYLYALHAPERNKHIYENVDESTQSGSGMSDAEAKAIIDSVNRDPRRQQFNELARSVRKMIDDRTAEMKRQGLIDDETFSSYQNGYKFYVPLKGQAGDEGGKPKGTGAGFNITGKESMKAMGRKSKAESPLVHAYLDTQQAIVRGQKNQVGNAMLNLIEEVPNEDYWNAYTTQGPMKVAQDKDGKKITRPMNHIEMAAAARNPNEPWFATKRDGKQYFLHFADPVLAQQLKNVGVDNGNFVTRVLGSINRYLATMSTSANPEFLFTNASRDIQTALFNLAAESDLNDGRIKGVDIKQFSANVLKDLPKSFNGIRKALRDDDLSSEWSQHFDQFRKNGAKTGYFDMKDLDQQTSALQAMMQLQSKKGMLQYGKKALKFIDDYNSSVENAIRLSVYKNAIDAGVTERQAALLAKDLTVNFNRKGEAGTWLNSLYLFANAGIQGTANFARAIGNFKVVDGKKKLNLAQKAGIVMAGIGFGMAALNRLIAGEDDDGESYWDKVPQHVKERNFVLMMPGSNDYVTLPMPYGYNIFANIGTAFEDVTFGEGDVAENTGWLAKAFLASFLPLGLGDGSDALATTIKTGAPQIMKPGFELVDNTNFFGANIYNDNNDRFDTKKSDAATPFKSTNQFYKSAAMGLNEATGGSEYRSGVIDVHPETIRYLVEYIAGGAGRFVANTFDSTSKAAKGEMEPDRTPFVRRFYGKTNDYGDQETFYNRLDEVETLDKELRSLRGPDRKAFRDEYLAKLRLAPRAKATSKMLSNLRKQKERAEQQNNSEQVDKIDERMELIIDRFNKQYNEAGD